MGFSAGPAGSLLHQTGLEKTWEPIPPRGGIGIDDLILGLPGGVIRSRSKGLAIHLMVDLAQTSPYPVVGSAVKLAGPSSTPNIDTEFTLDRGRVDLVNTATKGGVTVRVNFAKETWDLTLAEPGTRAVLLFSSRWPKGFQFLNKPTDATPRVVEDEDQPTSNFVLLVTRGEASLKVGPTAYILKAPPGPARFEWDSVTGREQSPKALQEIPAWAAPEQPETPALQALEAELDLFRRRVSISSVDEAVTEALDSVDPVYRKIGVGMLAATGDLAKLLDALERPDRADVRENAVKGLRHFMGRAPDNDTKIYKAVTEIRKFTPAEARTVVELLHTPDDNDANKPETYELLIARLNSARLAIRELARFHLYLLVKDSKIEYDAAAPAEERVAAQKKWKELIPEGKLPKGMHEKTLKIGK